VKARRVDDDVQVRDAEATELTFSAAAWEQFIEGVKDGEFDRETAVTADLRQAGAFVIAEPTTTPWNSLNARLDGPAGLHLTVFQELGPASDEAPVSGTAPESGTAPGSGTAPERGGS